MNGGDQPARERADGRAIISHEKYLTVAYEDGSTSIFAFPHFSLAFYTFVFQRAFIITIIIMRLTTFVALMLPLAALAASTPTPPQPDSADTLGSRFVQAAEGTLSAINATINQLNASTNRQERAVLHRVQDANKVFQIAVLAATNLSSLNSTNPREAEYVDSFCAYMMVKNKLTRHFCSCSQFFIAAGSISAQTFFTRLNKTVNGEYFSQKDTDNPDLNQLRSNIFKALDGSNKMVQVSVDILANQGKTVRQLFEKPGFPVPPGF